MNIWRISEYASLKGRGGELYEGRWNYQGDAIVYCCEHAAHSMLEILVNADPSLLPSSYQLLTIHVPDGVSREAAKLPKGWHQDRDETRAHWRSFWQQNRAALLRVPSVIMPHAYNWLINPKHPD
ncbi:MAG: RES family NAD+ phosphorylase, partial [Pseudomonadota bacterium]